VRVEITVGGKPWREQFDDVQRRYRDALFAQLDGDRDGLLSPAEARRLPPPRSWSSLGASDDVHVAFNFRVLDADGDGSASRAEFEQYAIAFGNLPLRMISIPAGRSSDDLFRALDADRDRVLTSAEWQKADKLFDKDRDGNRVLTADELQGPAPIAMPPEFVAGVAGNRGFGPPLTVELQPAGESPADARVLVEYSDHGTGPKRPKVTVQLAQNAAKQGVVLESSAPGELVLVVGGRRLVLRVSPPSVRSGAAFGQQLLEQFDALAEGGKSSLPAAASMPMPLNSVFATADSNDDGELDRAELTRYIESLLPLQLAAESAGLRFVQFAERSGLMPIVDGNLDGRISRREMQELPRKLAAIAGDAGRLARDKVPPTLVLVLQHGPFRETDDQMILENAGPPWFFRADRNQDGDLDREEFLGDPEVFQRLDANRDGWIDLEEAIIGDADGAVAGAEGKK
jgi:Ca2+-binding EF-hand superfamily protein